MEGFVYDLPTSHKPLLGSVCGNPVPLVDPYETPAIQIIWVDAKRFVFAVVREWHPRQLRLGQVGGESVLIGPFGGESAYYEVKQEGQDVVIP